MVDDPVDRRRGHRVLDDAIPLAEDDVARDEDAAALVTFREECEEHLHLVATLLDVADVVEDDGVETVQQRELLFEAQVALGGEQPLYQGVRGGEQDAVAPQYKLVADGADEVRLAATWQAEGEDVVAALSRPEPPSRAVTRLAGRSPC